MKVQEIVINGRFLGRKPTGVDRFAYEIISAISEMIRQNHKAVQGLSFKIAVPKTTNFASPFEFIPFVPVGFGSGQLWEQVVLPFYIRRNTLLISLCNTGPIAVPQQIAVIHDAATVVTPSAFSLAFRIWYRLLLPILGKSVQRIVTVSEFSKKEITSMFGISTRIVRTVGEGGEHILRISSADGAIERYGLVPKCYFLAVSSMAAHKNFGLVVQALSKLEDPPFDVAIAGGANSRVFGNSGILDSPQIKWLGYVSDEELRALYESAMWFVFPSIYEGFGIPPLEAMNCGCPVLASNAASIPEVCGDAALYFNPNDADELAALLLRVSKDAELRAEFSRKGLARAQEFSWENAARQILDVCREIIS